ncbi:uncharacterized protein [Ptychodera flava]|uniref:uncharacterized protein n=1 Tax=Ptychodera flava TaxID=63121 RepID=UPI00396A27D3
MDIKSWTSLMLTALAMMSAANALKHKKRQLSTDPECINPLYPLICADRQACIKESQLCDGIKSCKDNSDEENCDGVVEGGEGDDESGEGGNEGDEGGDENEDDEGGDEGTGDSDCNSGTKTKGSCTNPTGEATCNTGLEDLRQQMLNSHNYYRCLHGLTGEFQMTLADDLNEHAQEWAEYLASTDSSEHSTDRGENPPQRGENIWTGSDFSRWTEEEQFTGEAPVGDWYSEINNYDFNTFTAVGGAMVGHFTQVVWKSSTELGCGVGIGERPWGPMFYVVCQYREAGNIADPSENVPPPL